MAGLVVAGADVVVENIKKYRQQKIKETGVA
jgi:hypothetical protein